jgi:hypothetical protein
MPGFSFINLPSPVAPVPSDHDRVHIIDQDAPIPQKQKTRRRQLQMSAEHYTTMMNNATEALREALSFHRPEESFRSKAKLLDEAAKVLMETKRFNHVEPEILEEVLTGAVQPDPLVSSFRFGSIDTYIIGQDSLLNRIRSRVWESNHPLFKFSQLFPILDDDSLKSTRPDALEIDHVFGNEDAITSLIQLCPSQKDDIELLIDVFGWVSTSAPTSIQ